MIGRTASDNPYALAAKPVFAFVEDLDRYMAEGEHRLIKHAVARLDTFAAAIEQTDLPAASIKPARYALAALIDGKMRQQPKLRLSTWDVLAHQKMFDSRMITPARIAEFHKTALGQGEEFAPLVAFLDDLHRRSTQRGISLNRPRSRWRLTAFACIALLVAVLIGTAL